MERSDDEPTPARLALRRARRGVGPPIVVCCVCLQDACAQASPQHQIRAASMCGEAPHGVECKECVGSIATTDQWDPQRGLPGPMASIEGPTKTGGWAGLETQQNEEAGG